MGGSPESFFPCSFLTLMVIWILSEESNPQIHRETYWRLVSVFSFSLWKTMFSSANTSILSILPSDNMLETTSPTLQKFQVFRSPFILLLLDNHRIYCYCSAVQWISIFTQCYLHSKPIPFWNCSPEITLFSALKFFLNSLFYPSLFAMLT